MFTKYGCAVKRRGVSASLLEVSQALAGTLSLQAGLYGVLEVLERRCGIRGGAVTLVEEASSRTVRLENYAWEVDLE